MVLFKYQYTENEFQDHNISSYSEALESVMLMSRRDML